MPSVEQIDIASAAFSAMATWPACRISSRPVCRSSEPELRHCAAHGIAFLPFSPLGGISRAGQLGQRHGAFQEVATARGVSPQQVALAWMLAKAPVIIPIPGASRPESVIDSAAAADLVLSGAELDRLDQA